MSTQVMATDGDRLDLICWRHYGNLEGRIVEQVLNANPGMAMSAQLQAGQVVLLPIIDTPNVPERSLW